MNCKDFREHVTDAVDRRLPEGDWRTFRAHAEVCPSCRTEFEDEAVTKELLRTRVRMQRTPADVMARIADVLERERAHPAPRFVRWRERLSRSVVVRPALVFAAACLGVILLLRGQNQAPASVMDQSLANYRAVLAGGITPQVVDSLPSRIAGFFAGKTRFPVVIPHILHARLVGGVVNDFEGIPLAHLVYAHGNDLVYVYQACWHEVQRGDHLDLPGGVRDEIRRTGRYATEGPDGYSMVLWADDSTLCSAVARMPKEELVACLAAGTP